MPTVELPGRPPYALRARVLSPLGDGGTLDEADGLVAVDAGGRIAFAGPASGAPAGVADGAVDLRPWVVLPGMVDLHAHLPQLPNAGLGFALDLLTWLERLTFPTERSWADPAVAAALSPAIFRAFAAAGTTTVMAYGVVYEAAMDEAFRAAEAHGIRAILGKVMMDRVTYDPTIEPSTILERSLRESADLISRWHGAADGRLGYAVTPRFAVSCTADLLRESASLARSTGAWWQSHVSEDAGEIAEVARQFPEALDYVDVYDRAGALGPRSVLAHAIHLSAARGGADRRDRDAGGALPCFEPVHRRGRDAAVPLARGGDRRRARVGRVGRTGSVDLRRDAGRGVLADGAAGGRRRAAAGARAARLAPARDDRGRSGARPLGRHRLARGGQGGRPDRGRPAP